MYSGLCSLQRKEAPREDEEHELDQLEPEPEAEDATQVSWWSRVWESHREPACPATSPIYPLQRVMPTSTEPDIDNCTVHVLSSQSPVRQRPSELQAPVPWGCPGNTY